MAVGAGLTSADGPSNVGSGHVPVLSVHDISKSFGGVHALRGVSLQVLPGEVHGLLGENGSGKSTLIKILSGFHDPDQGGQLDVNGQEVKLPLSPGQFRDLGLSFVHQDLGLIESMSALENLRITDWAVSGSWRLSWTAEKHRADAELREWNVSLDLEARISDLPAVDRAILAIVRAAAPILTRQRAGDTTPCLLVLDEPTAFLPRAGIDRLFGLIRAIRRGGSSVLFVSHDLSEVREIADRITVLRDGRALGTLITAEASDDELVEMIIGHRLAQLSAGRRLSQSAASRVRIEHVESRYLHDVSMTVREGEILGLTGLAGSGFEDMPYVLSGASSARDGRLVLGDRPVELRATTPAHALSLGIAMLPADRADGSVATLTVADNVTLPVLGRFQTWLGLHRRALGRAARRLLQEYRVRPPDPTIDYGALSGGNQQKALVAKWLQVRPLLLLLHEPTQGVDVGSRQEIFRMLREAARAGTCIICASTDAEQLAAICDRVLIFARGVVVQELTGEDITKERISEQSYTSLGLTRVATLGAQA